MLRRYLKYGLMGAAGFATTATMVRLHEDNYDLNSLVFVRSGRCLITTFQIAALYKTKLYARNLDKNSEEYRDLRSETHQLAAEKLLELCRRNKGVFVKVGQHIGAMDHVLPIEYVRTLRILHKEAPVTPLNMIFRVIKEDLNIDATQVFDKFESEPLGAASLAQVHKATLKDGTTVAVKIQHPFVKRNIDVDVKTVEILVKFMEYIFPDFKMDWLVKMTKKNIFKELDFKYEASNAERVAGLFKDYKWFKIPKIYWDYTSKRVLCMEYVEGGLVNDIGYMKRHKIDPYEVSRKLGDIYSHMIFVHGFVHGDPHSGNIVVKKDPKDKEVTIYLLDHGLYGTLTEEFRFDYSQLWLSIIKRDFNKVKYYSRKMGIDENLYFLFACIVTGRPWNSIKMGIRKARSIEEEKAELQKSVPELLTSVSQCLDTVDPQILIVLKTNDLIRSIEYMLKTQQKMCGFTVMTKCCLQTVNDGHVKNSKSTLDKVCVRVKHFYTMFAFYLYSLMAEIRFKLSY